MEQVFKVWCSIEQRRGERKHFRRHILSVTATTVKMAIKAARKLRAVLPAGRLRIIGVLAQ